MDLVDVLEIDRVVGDRRGNVYEARILGRVRDDGHWDGHIELRGDDGTVVISGPETTQPDLDALVYWASGLSTTYLEGALARALEEGEVRRPGEAARRRAPRTSGGARPS